MNKGWKFYSVVVTLLLLLLSLLLMVKNTDNPQIMYSKPYLQTQTALYPGRIYANINEVAVTYTPGVNCLAILTNNTGYIEKIDKLQQNQIFPDKSENLLNLSKNCAHFIKTRKYVLHPVNQEEEEFPLAYTIIMHVDPTQAERHLRAIYRPQNLYCIHIDKKSNALIHSIMNNIANCFDNVFIASTVHDVIWGTYTILEPEFTCMKDFLKDSRPWKYFINTCGQEFAIKTNLEIVRILKAYNGSNDIQGELRQAGQ
jgi:hypothetical protein